MNTLFVEFLAKFNAKTQRYERGTGGQPLIGPGEVADGLNAITDKVGGAILCCAAWPSSRQMYIGTVLDHARKLLIDEHDRRHKRYIEAWQEAEDEAKRFDRPPRSRTRAQILLSAAKAQRWPDWLKNLERYHKIPTVVCDEVTRCPTICTGCNGNRTVWLMGEQKDCDQCDGTGVYRAPKDHRARALGIVLNSYKQSWAEPYEHVHAELTQRMWAAAIEFGQRIRQNLEAA